MPTATPNRILLCAADPPAVDDVRRLLEQAGFAVGWRAVGGTEPEDVAAYDLVVMDSGSNGAAGQLCRRFRARLGDDFVPILWLTAGADVRLAALESGADGCLPRPFSSAELLAQVRAFLRLKGQHNRLTEKTAEFHRVSRSLHQTYQKIDQEMELARRIQQSLLPRTLPEMPSARFAVHYRPCGRVGGDFYDAFRLDEHHAGFYVADVMGHGVPAGLLTMFLKKAVRAKEINGRDYRLLPPDEVLSLLNREMLDQALAENPFITMVYALFDGQQRTFSFARAGHPHPLYLPRGGAPQLLEVHGTLLGVFDTQFTVRTQPMQPGDKVLLYTDGLETFGAEGRSSADMMLAGIGDYRDLPIDELVARFARALTQQTKQPDDFTLLGLEVTA